MKLCHFGLDIYLLVQDSVKRYYKTYCYYALNYIRGHGQEFH